MLILHYISYYVNIMIFQLHNVVINPYLNIWSTSPAPTSTALPRFIWFKITWLGGIKSNTIWTKKHSESADLRCVRWYQFRITIKMWPIGNPANRHNTNKQTDMGENRLIKNRIKSMREMKVVVILPLWHPDSDHLQKLIYYFLAQG